MASITNASSDTNEIEIPTRNELIHYVWAVSKLMSQQALNIEGYKRRKYYRMNRIYDHQEKKQCEKILEEFMNKYPNFSI